jgi:hypothetical protein
VPCDTGGLAACLYWRTHGYSPGEPDHRDDWLAWDVYWQMQRLGWEAVQSLRKLDQLDAADAETLLMRLVALHDAIQAQRRDRQDQY